MKTLKIFDCTCYPSKDAGCTVGFRVQAYTVTEAKDKAKRIVPSLDSRFRGAKGCRKVEAREVAADPHHGFMA